MPIFRTGPPVFLRRDTPRVVSARYPHHVWHVNLTLIPAAAGFRAPWFPFSRPQIRPFCWWTVVVMDHFSWQVVGLGVFKRPPASIQIRHFLGQRILRSGQSPRHLVCDKGSQFWRKGFKAWCKQRRIRPRFGSVGQYGSIAVIERFIRSMGTYIQ